MNNSNQSNFSGPGGALPSGSGSNSNATSQGSVADIIQIPFLSLTIIMACVYTVLLLVRAPFRVNKLNWLTINVCITSALLSVFLLLMAISRLNNSSSVHCRVQGFLLDMAACQMMYSHSVAAFSRYLVIVHTSKGFFRSNHCIWSCFGAGWLVAILVAVPYLLVDGFACSSGTEPAFLPYYTLITTLLLPATIVILCNVRILAFVRSSSRRVHAENGLGNGASHARDVQLLKTMLITFTIFFVGWAPLFFEQAFIDSSAVPAALDRTLQVLPSLSMLNDVLLLIYTNQPVRLYLKQLITRRIHIVPDAPITMVRLPNAQPTHILDARKK